MIYITYQSSQLNNVMMKTGHKSVQLYISSALFIWNCQLIEEVSGYVDVLKNYWMASYIPFFKLSLTIIITVNRMTLTTKRFSLTLYRMVTKPKLISWMDADVFNPRLKANSISHYPNHLATSDLLSYLGDIILNLSRGDSGCTSLGCSALFNTIEGQCQVIFRGSFPKQQCGLGE